MTSEIRMTSDIIEIRVADLYREPDGWHLRLQAASATFSAGTGEPIVYPGRRVAAAARALKDAVQA